MRVLELPEYWNDLIVHDIIDLRDGIIALTQHLETAQNPATAVELAKPRILEAQEAAEKLMALLDRLEEKHDIRL
jgi:transcriptional/translational regulatory protein YebC/TACO1